MNKEPTYENFDVWEAFTAVKNKKWNYGDFLSWASTFREPQPKVCVGEEKLAQWQINLRNDWLANG